jgi:hypothetical protein
MVTGLVPAASLDDAGKEPGEAERNSAAIFSLPGAATVVKAADTAIAANANLNFMPTPSCELSHVLTRQRGRLLGAIIRDSMRQDKSYFEAEASRAPSRWQVPESHIGNFLNSKV